MSSQSRNNKMRGHESEVWLRNDGNHKNSDDGRNRSKGYRGSPVRDH